MSKEPKQESAPKSFDSFRNTEKFKREFSRLNSALLAKAEAKIEQLQHEPLSVRIDPLKKIGGIDTFSIAVSGTHKISLHVLAEIVSLRSGCETVMVRKNIAVLRRIGPNASVDARP